MFFLGGVRPTPFVKSLLGASVYPPAESDSWPTLLSRVPLFLFSSTTFDTWKISIVKTSESCYYRLRRISSIQKYLSIEAAVILVTSTHSVTPLPWQSFPFWSTGLLPLSIAFVAYKTVLFASYWTRTHVKLTIIFLPFQFPHWLPTLQRIQYKIITICYKCTTRSECSVVSLWFSSTLRIRPPILSALLLIL